MEMGMLLKLPIKAPAKYNMGGIQVFCGCKFNVDKASSWN